MRILGLDIGSRSVDAVWVEDGAVVAYEIADSGFEPAAVYAEFLSRGEHDVVVATGYGRHAARQNLGCDAVTEIKAYAMGASRLFPEAGAVLDIGGQDTKVIILSPQGHVADFTMNDKCAAGTGRFLEVMAHALGYTLEEMATAALDAATGVAISSMCTVFAESEVTCLVHRGVDRGRIARGLHESIATRTLGSLKRLDASGPLVFAGGVAKNPAMVRLISDGFGDDVVVPVEAQTVGAYGAALSHIGSS
ncbi:MAG: acyl-CoA dehydratase activase [Actinomycetota bacterium]|nr:acyl-CoA dehydratase activase [Actinomycetota bacterium]